METEKQIKRISLFKLKKRNNSDIQAVADKLISMKGEIPSLIDMEVGINFSESNEAYDVLMIGTFKNREALLSYQQDPFHLKVKSFVEGQYESRAVVDYEL